MIYDEAEGRSTKKGSLVARWLLSRTQEPDNEISVEQLIDDHLERARARVLFMFVDVDAVLVEVGAATLKARRYNKTFTPSREYLEDATCTCDRGCDCCYCELLRKMP